VTDLLQVDATAQGTGGVLLPNAPKQTPISQPKSQVQAILNSQAARDLRKDGIKLSQSIEQVSADTARTEWEFRTRQRSKNDPLGDLRALGELGFAWRDIAKMLGVTVPAVQKWRRGGGIDGLNKERIHRLAAACDCLAHPFDVKDIAGWMERPLLYPTPVTPMDLWIAKEYDLLFAAADDNSDPEAILTKFDPEWRERYRSDFETYEAEDGLLAIRMKDR